jgi:hypothetical protein
MAPPGDNTFDQNKSEKMILLMEKLRNNQLNPNDYKQ